jgi:hypothetical protein
LTGATENGGSDILSYGLNIDDGAGGAFVQVVGELPQTAPYTLNSHTITTAINSGLSYRLTYKAYNVHGWGPDSPIATVIAATLPDPPLAPSLSVVGTNVQITWAAPTNTGGTNVAITAYRIEVQLADGTAREDTTNCDGTQATIVSNAQCSIPMATFTSTDANTGFSFSQGADIKARVTAATVIGYGSAGPYSAGTSVSAEVIPATPASAPTRGSGTGEAAIVIDWAALVSPENGGSAVTSYNLQWDQGTGTFSQSLVGLSSDYLQLTYTQTAGLLAGSSY